MSLLRGLPRLVALGWAILVSGLPLSAAPTLTEKSPAPLPPGLQVVQLNGNLVCPPLLVGGTNIFVACDDRTINLLSREGRQVWHLELDRSIKGPLAPLARSMVVVVLSGNQIACISLTGKLLWQRRLEIDGEYYLMASPDGRLIQLGKDGTIRYLNPDATPLFSFRLGQPLQGPPHGLPEGLELNTPAGKKYILEWNGSVSPRQSSAGTGIIQENLRFSATNLADGSYRVTLASRDAYLDFSSPGSIGHWLADNTAGTTVVWGDSLWRCFVFSPRMAQTGNPTEALKNPVPTDTWTSNPAGANLLEGRYLQHLMAEDPLAGADSIIRHIHSSLMAGKLPGRLDLYESVLLDIVIFKHGKNYRAGTEMRVRAINLLAQFPSLRQLDHLVRLARTETDSAVLVAILDFGTRLGIDPENHWPQLIQDRMPLWTASGTQFQLRESLLALAKRLGANWQLSNPLRENLH